MQKDNSKNIRYLVYRVLIRANLNGANFLNKDMSGSDLSEANLSKTIFINTNLKNCNIQDAYIFGTSVWDIKKNNLQQKNLIISKLGESTVTVDNLEVAQFIYLLLNNEKVRDVIGTIAQKGVLILGRFTPERKKILNAIREKLRQLGYVPMMFDFEKVTSRDFTETIKILVGLSKFVIADITNPSSSPLELQATVPNYMIPFVPIIQKGEHPFAMFVDLKIKYDWVLPLMEYGTEEELMDGFQKGIIDRALAVENKLLFEKTKTQLEKFDISNFK